MVAAEIIGQDGSAALERAHIGMGVFGLNPASALKDNDGSSFLQVFLGKPQGFSPAGVKINRNSPNFADVRRDVPNKVIFQRLEDRIHHQSKILEMTLKMFEDQAIKLLLAKDLFIGGKENGPRSNLEDNSDVFECSAMIAHNDVRAFPDKVFFFPDLDFFSEEGKKIQPADGGFDAFEFFFWAGHALKVFCSILSKTPKNTKNLF